MSQAHGGADMGHDWEVRGRVLLDALISVYLQLQEGCRIRHTGQISPVPASPQTLRPQVKNKKLLSCITSNCKYLWTALSDGRLTLWCIRISPLLFVGDVVLLSWSGGCLQLAGELVHCRVWLEWELTPQSPWFSDRKDWSLHFGSGTSQSPKWRSLSIFRSCSRVTGMGDWRIGVAYAAMWMWYQSIVMKRAGHKSKADELHPYPHLWSQAR